MGEVLNKKYRLNMPLDEGIKLGLSALKDFLKEEFNFDRVDAAYVDIKDRKFTKLSNEELKKLMK